MNEQIQLELFEEIQRMGYKVIEIAQGIWNIINEVTEDIYRAVGLEEVQEFFEFIRRVPLTLV